MSTILIENGVIKPTGSEDPDFKWTVANPINIADERHKAPVMAPEIGEHSEDVLRECGYGDAEISELRRSGAVYETRASFRLIG